MIKKFLFSLSLVSLLALSLAGLVIAAPGEVTDADALRSLAMVRRATVKYHDVSVALADGFVSTVECVEEPGLGAMGIHYIRPDRIMDPSLDPAEPEVLLYMPTAEGLRLVGVEYMLALGPPDSTIPDPVPPAPSLFGQTFDGPMPPHGPGQPPHYDLHVWLWQANPAGVFFPFNANLSCR